MEDFLLFLSDIIRKHRTVCCSLMGLVISSHNHNFVPLNCCWFSLIRLRENYSLDSSKWSLIFLGFFLLPIKDCFNVLRAQRKQICKALHNRTHHLLPSFGEDHLHIEASFKVSAKSCCRKQEKITFSRYTRQACNHVYICKHSINA